MKKGQRYVIHSREDSPYTGESVVPKEFERPLLRILRRGLACPNSVRVQPGKFSTPAAEWGVVKGLLRVSSPGFVCVIDSGTYYYRQWTQGISANYPVWDPMWAAMDGPISSGLPAFMEVDRFVKNLMTWQKVVIEAGTEEDWLSCTRDQFAEEVFSRCWSGKVVNVLPPRIKLGRTYIRLTRESIECVDDSVCMGGTVTFTWDEVLADPNVLLFWEKLRAL